MESEYDEALMTLRRQTFVAGFLHGAWSELRGDLRESRTEEDVVAMAEAAWADLRAASE